MKVVGIGGGHGLAATLRAARTYGDEVSAVVTVADDGGSSGRLMRDLGIPPPGDIRNCLVALADDGPLGQLFQHRFKSGELEGHTVGNILLAALTEMRKDFADAVAEAGKMLGVQGNVYPATTELVSLSALVEGGIVRGQAAVAQTRAPIRSVHLKPSSPAAHREAVYAILEADQVVIGPGSLFTSVIATLLVPGIAKALGDTPAVKVFVCNSRQQSGETESLDVSDHVGALLAHAGPSAVDTVIVQEPQLEGGVSYAPGSWGFPDVEVVVADVAEDDGAHDPERLAKILKDLGPSGQ
jgi:uncharacterized cofD-like protein